MKMIKVMTWLLAVAAALCFVVMPAHAGIIITEGKIASQGKSAESKASSGRRGAAATTTTDEDCDELDDNGFCIQTGETVDDVDLGDIDDLDTDAPEGWICSDVGGGLQYCEPATGSSPGAGAGAGLGEGASMDDHSATMAGCQGGAGGPFWPALILLLGVAMFGRRQPQGA